MHIAATIISPYLKDFIDFFFKNGIFPESCTLAKVIPLCENGSKLDPNNYRPISILTCFSKILERLIYNRLQQVLKKHSVIHKPQYGFRKSISTEYAVLDNKNSKNNISHASIQNYKFVFSNSTTNAGGVAIYRLNNLKYSRRHDLEFQSADSETVFIELNLATNKKIMIPVRHHQHLAE